MDQDLSGFDDVLDSSTPARVPSAAELRALDGNGARCFALCCCVQLRPLLGSASWVPGPSAHLRS